MIGVYMKRIKFPFQSYKNLYKINTTIFDTIWSCTMCVYVSIKMFKSESL